MIQVTVLDFWRIFQANIREKKNKKKHQACRVVISTTTIKVCWSNNGNELSLHTDLLLPVTKQVLTKKYCEARTTQIYDGPQGTSAIKCQPTAAMEIVLML